MKKYVLIFLILPLGGMWVLGQGSWPHTKAALAQLALHVAWSKAVQDNREVRPWPWADTWPVSRLSVPRLSINRIVLAEASQSSLSLGPGRLFKDLTLTAGGNMVISGDRNTHFMFLQELTLGDTITLQDKSGTEFVYRINNIFVTTDIDNSIADDKSAPQLTLIASYNTEQQSSGGPEKLVVTAVRTAIQEYI